MNIKQSKKNKEVTESSNNKKTNLKYKIIKILIAIFTIAIIAVILVNVIPILKQITTHEGKIAFKEKIQNLGIQGILIIFALEVAQIFLFILPGEPIEIVAGMCYGGFWETVLLLVSSTIISAIIFYLVRILGRRFVYEFSDEEKVKKIENSKLFKDFKKIELIMFILFLIPGSPKDLLVYIAGLLPIKPSRFIVITTIARIPSIVSSTYAGEKILNGDYKVAFISYGIIIAIAIIAVFIINLFDKDKTAEKAFREIK